MYVVHRMALCLTAALLMFGSAAYAQEVGDVPLDISPIGPEACPYDVPTWSTMLLPVETTVIATRSYTADELVALLSVGQPGDRLSLPLVVHLAQELVAYRMNVVLGFTPTIEADLASTQAEERLAALFGGLPTESPDVDGVSDEPLLSYLDSILSAYNTCQIPTF